MSVAVPRLLADCPLPGCTNLVADPRMPCPECLEAFGEMLQPTGDPVDAEVFAERVAERDRATAVAYRAMAEVARPASTRGAPSPARPDPTAVAVAVAEEVEWKRNQTCWICEERRKCRPDPHHRSGLICGKCFTGYGPDSS